VSPLENYDENKLRLLDSTVHKFYDIVKSSHIEESYKLNKFLDVDLEQETQNGEVDLMKLLGLN
jgi:hypothetical protein